ncbi:hypothetical protein ACH4OV_25345 [Streptomyces diastaticus]|uniref:hypothetical protein n=1 Tax=Streptomyces diastaticus TaxID=1956 RepID=UPI0037A553A9
MITDIERAEMAEIVRLLREAYDHYFTYEGHCKSAEGAISLNFTNVHDWRGGEPFRIESVEVYSYVLGPNRSHHFASTAKALEAVRGWHAKEMAYDPATAWDEEDED